MAISRPEDPAESPRRRRLRFDHERLTLPWRQRPARIVIRDETEGLDIDKHWICRDSVYGLLSEIWCHGTLSDPTNSFRGRPCQLQAMNAANRSTIRSMRMCRC